MTGAAADLHLHSHYSDGSFPPAEVVRRAAAAGLAAIALTDHDTVEGLPEFLAAAAGAGLHAIPGVELSVDEGDREIHLLGYLIRWEDPALRAVLTRFAAERRVRAAAILSRLQAMGVRIPMAAVEAAAGRGTLGRPHVAAALVEAGKVGSVQEAFDRYLGRGKPAYVPRTGFTAAEAIALVWAAGGIPVLAHPVRSGVLDEVPRLAREGLRGLEAYHPAQGLADTLAVCRSAEAHGLLLTGGSDWHAEATAAASLGSVRLPWEHVQRLYAAAGQPPPA
ncbi:MAG: PHP domain-containing protein [candidate division NC10 bacterium]|nr:PHP domain-containing protein [candidate division NC10 bacterium]